MNIEELKKQLLEQGITEEDLKKDKEKNKNKDTYLISAQVFGNGVDRWILSQGDAIELIEDN